MYSFWGFYCRPFAVYSMVNIGDFFFVHSHEWYNIENGPISEIPRNTITAM